MLVPHLIFTHLLTDYVLQTNWVVRMKNKGWPGLILHGGTFFVISLIALYRYIDIIFLPLLLLSIEHILQDSGKIRISRKFPQHNVAFYFWDQALHLIGIFLVQWAVNNRLDPEPDNFELFLFMLGSSFIMVTRFFEITLVANYPKLRDYNQQWLLWGYVERVLILLLVTGIGPLGIPISLLCLAPHGWRANQRGEAIWENRYRWLEMGTGFLLSILLGLGLWNILRYI